MADKRISQLVDRGTVANNDVVPIVVSGATTTNKATISSIQTFMQGNLDLGVTSVGITLGSSGTDVSVSGSPITSSGNITINLPTASATNRGLLSAADWVTFNSKQDAGSFVTLNTAQTITAQKTFTTSGSSDTMIISHGSGSGFALDVLKAGNGEAIRVTKTSGSGNAMTISGGNFEAGTIVKTGGTSSQFLKADGSVDSSSYALNSSLSLYLPLTGGTISGQLNVGSGNLRIAAEGASNITILRNFTGTAQGQSGFNNIGFNNSNNFYFTKNLNNGCILSFNNTAYQTYTLPDASGTIALTSSLSGYLPLTGGTLSNNLFITGGGLQVSGSASANRQVVELYTSSTVSRLAASYVGSSSYGDLELLTGGLARLTIAAGGATTLTGALNGTSAVFNGSVSSANTGGSAGSVIISGSQSNVKNYQLTNVIPGVDNTGFTIRNTTDSRNELTFNGTGAATFSSSVTAASGVIESGGLNIKGTGGVAKPDYLRLSNASAGAFFWDIWRDNTTGNLNFGSAVGGAVSNYVSFTSSGNVGIGTASPNSKLEVVDGTGSVFRAINSGTNIMEIGNYKPTGSGGSGYQQLDIVSSTITFGTGTAGTGSATERMRITSGGNVQIGTTATDAKLYVKGASNTNSNFAFLVNNSNPSDLFYLRNDGLINTGTQSASPYNNSTSGRTMVIESSGTLGYTSSTRESKANITSINDVSWLYGLNPVSFNYRKKDDEMNYTEEYHDEKWYGLIADEVESINEDLVFYNIKEDGAKELAGVEYQKITSVLIKAIQELKTEIDSLKNQMQ